MTLSSFQRSFQPVLDRAVRDALRRVRALTKDGDVRGVAEYAGHIARQDGKRLRPYLAVLMYRAAGGRKMQDAIRLSVALELFHAFALIHDDIMDQGTLRHGLRTVHLEIARRRKAAKRIGDLDRIGESHAILAGDLLFTWAMGILSSHSGISERCLEKARCLFSSLSEEVIIGQMLDVDLPTRAKTTRSMINEKMRRKTAGYSFVKPLQFGAALAGADRRIHRWCETFGTSLGLAFQIQDDLLDLTVPSAVSKKTPFSDLTERQQTVFTQDIREHGTIGQRRELERMMGKRLTEMDRSRVDKLFRGSGSLAAGANGMLGHFTDAEAFVGRSTFSQGMRSELNKLVFAIKNRTH